MSLLVCAEIKKYDDKTKLQICQTLKSKCINKIRSNNITEQKCFKINQDVIDPISFHLINTINRTWSNKELKLNIQVSALHVFNCNLS